MMNTKQLRVGEIMQRNVKTIRREAPLDEAAKMMHEFGISSLVIKPENDMDAHGIITRKDLIEYLLMDEQEDFSYQVADIMSKPVITVTSNLSIDNCLQMMRRAGVRRLPVVDDNQLVGLISNTDIFKKFIGRAAGE